MFNEGGSILRGDVIQVNARGVAITPAIEYANGTKISEVETSRYKVIDSKNSVRWVCHLKLSQVAIQTFLKL